MSLHRAEKLIDLACSTTHEEEARTAALAACRLIRKQGLQLVHGRVGDVPRAAQRSRPAPTAAREPPRQKPPNGGTWSQARRSERCESCGGDIGYGDDVYVVADVVWCNRH
jgi:hypothetical protein